jgi:hypothetical protein
MKTKTYMQYVATFALGSRPWQRGLEGCGPRGSLKVTPHAPRSVRKFEGMNPHTPKATPILRDGVLVDFRIFRRQSQGSKLNGLKSFLYHWKDLGTKMSKMRSHNPFGHLKHKLWPTKRSGVKLPIWLPTIKSWESTQFRCVQVTCDIPLESSQQGLQLYFRLHFNWWFAREVMEAQSCKSPNFSN